MRAVPAAIDGTPPGNHASIGDHRYWLLVHDPFGRPWTMRCSVERRNSTRVDIPTVPAHVLPSPTESCSPSPGTAFDSSEPVASPRASSSATVLVSTSRNQRVPSVAIA